MNYFNYFTEIEEEFVRRRGSHMLVSPLDWSLIEAWKQRDVPLHVVLRGIKTSFDSYDEKPRRGRKVNSLFYCQQEVEAMFEEYIESRVGGNHAGQNEESGANGTDDAKTPDGQFNRAALIDYLTDHLASINRLMERNESRLAEVFARASSRLERIIEDLRTSDRISLEALEADLTLVEEVILEGLREDAGEDALAAMKKEGNQQLRAYKQTMEREFFDQTLANFMANKLREKYSVPRLSLFYL
ncbi:MAG: hypothetical protein IPM66_19800 [Acidobacteriota bacterium]|nr:MAG: hypothetical protein IPM66_19800 [Acidobacteriota bacterium]